MVQISEVGLKWLQVVDSTLKPITIPSEDVRLDKYVQDSNRLCKPYWFMPGYEIVTVGSLYEKPNGFMYIRETSVIAMGSVVKPLSDKLVWLDRERPPYFTLYRRSARIWRHIVVTYPLGQQIVDLVRATLRLKIKPLKTRR